MLYTEHRGYKIEPDKTFGNKVIKQNGSGALPKALRGSFTNHKQAASAIDIYLASKGNKNAKENNSG